MNAKQFKTRLSQIKDYLKGSEIELNIPSTNNQYQKENFKTLEDFLSRVNELETAGAKFFFRSVENDLVVKSVVEQLPKLNLDYLLKRGTWNKFNFNVKL